MISSAPDAAAGWDLYCKYIPPNAYTYFSTQVFVQPFIQLSIPVFFPWLGRLLGQPHTTWYLGT